MYDIKDKKAAIREIQRYIFVATDGEEGYPHVSISGICDAETKHAVEILQHEMGIDESGEIDIITFNGIYARYLSAKAQNEVKSATIRYDDYPLMRLDSGTSVARLNYYMRELLPYYDLEHTPEENVFTQTTAANVQRMQAIFGYEVNGIADADFTDRLHREVAIREKFK